MTPSSVVLHKKSRRLELQYRDRDPIILDAEYLRVHSPSAEVRGHHPSQATLQHGKQQVAIRSLTPAGNYAVQIDFDDGHNSGIYSWEYLYDLGVNHSRYWQHYLEQLDAAGKSRDPNVQVVQLIDPRAN